MEEYVKLKTKEEQRRDIEKEILAYLQMEQKIHLEATIKIKELQKRREELYQKLNALKGEEERSMATHVAELWIKRLYKVYVEDPDNSMTNEQAEAKAKEMALEDDNNLSIVDDFEMEEQDIVYADYQYDLDD